MDLPTVEIMNWICYGNDIPETGAEFIAEMQKHLAAIPADCRHTAKFELNGGYDESTSISLTYKRPLTARELKARDNEHRRNVENILARERAEYARLKAKYGDGL